METYLLGRVRNTTLPYTSGLLPLFEAVVNSIHAVGQSGSTDDGSIIVEIIRKQKTADLGLDDRRGKSGPEATDEIIAFRVTDNGIGFTKENMKSFETLDSDYKADLGCRGIGRLLWLKAFDRVRVESVFQEAGSPKKRSFVFNAGGVSNQEVIEVSGNVRCETIVEMEGFRESYRNRSRKTLRPIAVSILEHCLWYFIRPGGAPDITVFDNGESVTLQQVFDEDMHSQAVAETIKIKGVKFDLTHFKLRSNSLSTHAIAFCADDRLVLEEKLTGRVPGLHKRISDSGGEFVYSCYVSSDFLDAHVRPERTGFDLLENVEGSVLEGEISLDDIRTAVADCAKVQLAEHLAANLDRAKARVEKFVTQRAPRYRPIIKRIPVDQLNVDPDITDKELELTLHKQLAQFEGDLINEGHNVMEPRIGESVEAYRQRLSEYLSKADDIKKSDLASYVSHRKVILDILAKALERKPDGSYEREDMIHELIMPMRTDSNDEDFGKANLWLVDERLAFHDYLGSDKTLKAMPITGSEATKEADLCSLSVFDNPLLVSEGHKLPLATIVIVEIKRPMRNDAAQGEEKDPIEQALGYLDRIRKGEAQTANGRLIPGSLEIPGYCYVLCDLTSKMVQRCRFHNLTVTKDLSGYFGYNDNFKAYIEVISFDQLVNAARERNRAFFDKLGFPAS